MTRNDDRRSRWSIRAAADKKTLSNRRSSGRPAFLDRTLDLVAKDQDLDLAITSTLCRWHEAEHAAEDQVEDGEQHRGILREQPFLARAGVFDPFKDIPRSAADPELASLTPRRIAAAPRRAER